MFITIPRRAATILAALLLTAQSAIAQIRHDGLNDDQLSIAGNYTINAIGWFYTPVQSYWLTRIETTFNADAYFEGCCLGPVERTVTVELLSGPRSYGGTLIRSGQFNSLDALGVYGGATFSPLYVMAGTTYFVGFRDVLGLGANISFSPSTAVQTYRVDQGTPLGMAGQYAEEYTQRGYPIGPMLRFSGPADDGQPVHPVPEPSSSSLWISGVLLWVYFRWQYSRASPRCTLPARYGPY